MSRHAPQPAIAVALAAYEIFDAHPVERFGGAIDAWAYVQKVSIAAYGRHPDVIMAVLPDRWRDLFVKIVGDSRTRTRVCKLVMLENAPDQWSGRFAQLCWSGKEQRVMRFSWTPIALTQAVPVPPQTAHPF